MIFYIQAALPWTLIHYEPLNARHCIGDLFVTTYYDVVVYVKTDYLVTPVICVSLSFFTVYPITPEILVKVTYPSINASRVFPSASFGEVNA